MPKHTHLVKSKSMKDVEKWDIPIAFDGDNVISISTRKVENKQTEYDTSNKLQHIPYLDVDKKQRSAVYISGISGSGKSTLASNLIKAYRKRLDKPKLDCIFFTTGSEKDPAFNKLKNFHHISIRDDPLFLEIQIEHLKDSIVIFDDYTAIADKILQAKVMNLLNDLLERSRKLNVQIIVINHQTQNYQKTRLTIFECDTYFLNPNVNEDSVRKFLKSYVTDNKYRINEMVESAQTEVFDWVVVRKSFPMYYASNHKIKLL